MSEYIFFGSVITILTVLSEITRNELRKSLFLYLIILSIFLIGCRYYIGKDWDGYKFLYENGYSYSTLTGNVEYGYMLWNKVISFLGLSSGMYFAITSFISFVILYKAAKLFQVQNICFVFLIYYCLFLPSLQFNIVRNGLLGSCFILSLGYWSVELKRKSLFWLIIGISMHYSGIIFLPIIYFIKTKLSLKKIIYTIILIIIVSKIGVTSLINKYAQLLFVLDNRIDGYINNSEEGLGISIGTIFNIVFFLVLFKTNKLKYEDDCKFRVLLNSLFISICITFLLADLSIFVARLGQILNLSLIMLWPLFVQQLRQRSPYVRVMVFVFLLYYLPSYFLKGIGYYDLYSETRDYPYRYKIEQLF